MGLTTLRFVAAVSGCILFGTQSATAASSDVCQYIVSLGPQHVLEYTLQSGMWDVNGDGAAETVTLNTNNGTMHPDDFDVARTDGARIPFQVPFSAGAAMGARWLLRNGRAYLLTFAYESARYILAAFTFDRNFRARKLCTFRNVIRRDFVADREGEQAICQAAGNMPGRPPNTIPDSHAIVSVDFDNDGRPDPLVLQFTNDTAGRGCQYDTFAFAPGKSASAHERELLAAIQEDGDSYSRVGSACPARQLSWFSFGKRNYLLSRPLVQGDPVDYAYADRLNAIVDGVPRRICEAGYTVTWKVSP